MSTSDRAYVWTWLPGESTPVPAGLALADGARLKFRYGQRYLARANAVSLGPDLPLHDGIIEPSSTLEVAGSLRDASPDAWGRQVIDFRLSGALAATADMGVAPELVYMLESDSNRFGAIDFQTSADQYVARGQAATLEQLTEAAERLSSGKPVPEEIGRALGHGTTMGGARPKATISDESGEYIAKFSRQSDTYDIVGAEAASMKLARLAGVDAALTEIVWAGKKKVLLVRRFDRTDLGHRRHVVSALTLSGLSEMNARYGTYPALVNRLRQDGTDPRRYGAEIFRRIAMNIAVSNNDDHLRNHAAFWDGAHLDLTPAYDICPQPRSGETSTQALGLTDDYRARGSSFLTLFEARKHYSLDSSAARSIIDEVIAVVDDGWASAADEAQMSKAEAQRMRGTQILNKGSLYGYERLVVSVPRGPSATAPAPRKQCGTLMPRRGDICSLPEGHYGWPYTGHKSEGRR